MDKLIDKEALLDRVEDDAELLLELIEMFQEDYPKLLTELRKALGRGDAPAARAAAHGLKGILGNFTDGPAYRTTAALEDAVREGELSSGAEQIAEIEGEIAVFLPALGSVLKELEGSGAKEVAVPATSLPETSVLAPSSPEILRPATSLPESFMPDPASLPVTSLSGTDVCNTAPDLPGRARRAKPASCRLVVFTDLDGCLLNEDGDLDPATLETLELLRSAGVPVVFVTSKTAAEVDVLQRELALETPYICENGALIHFHGTAGNEGGERDITLGTPYGVLRNFVKAQCHELLIRGFGDLEPEELAAMTGLEYRAALRALDRRFTEPLLCEPSVLPILRRRAHAQGFQVVDGGRFTHLMGAGHDKGSATRYLRSYLEGQYGPVALVAAGDSETDVPMLYEADQPIVVRKFATPPKLFVPGAWTSSEVYGSSAWNVLIRRALEAHAQGRLGYREPEQGRQAA